LAGRPLTVTEEEALAMTDGGEEANGPLLWEQGSAAD